MYRDLQAIERQTKPAEPLNSQYYDISPASHANIKSEGRITPILVLGFWEKLHGMHQHHAISMGCYGHGQYVDIHLFTIHDSACICILGVVTLPSNQPADSFKKVEAQGATQKGGVVTPCVPTSHTGSTEYELNSNGTQKLNPDKVMPLVPKPIASLFSVRVPSLADASHRCRVCRSRL